MSRGGYIAVEGPIGVGKTSLAEQLAARLDGRVVYELAEGNPFLADFYKEPRQLAFQTQVFFLMSRYSRQQLLANRDLFSGMVISDYLFAKDRIFAGINLSDDELALYNRIAEAIMPEGAKPDLVIYLTATLETLLERIARRGRDFERGMNRGYIETVREAYSDYFFHYTETPLLVVKTDGIDFARDSGNFDYLVDKILSPPRGTEYISFDRLTLEGI